MKYDCLSAPEQPVITTDDRVLHAAVVADLGRYRGQSRLHTDSDLKILLTWCSSLNLNPLHAARTDIEQDLRWLQDVSLYQPSTLSRRLLVVIGFYRVCGIDEILAHSPADYVRRPPVPPESPRMITTEMALETIEVSTCPQNTEERAICSRRPR